MITALKRIADLSIVSRVLQSPAQYSDVSSGFVQDRAKLRGDANLTASHLNRNIKKYGNEKYTG